MSCQTNPLASSTPSSDAPKPPKPAVTTTAAPAPIVPPRRSAHIAIDIPAIPAPYMPGSGPVSRDATIIPVHDSTAYIIGRMFLPEGVAADGELRPKSLAWLIGFHDRPAARIAVRAHQVLDYVSPRELEDYEYRQWLRRQEQAQNTAGADTAAEQQQQQQQKQHEAHSEQPERLAVKKARGRKLKKKPGSRVLVEPQIQVASESSSEAPLLPAIMSPVKNSGPSLSPKKRKLADLNPISLSEVSEDDPLQKQLRREVPTRASTPLYAESNDTEIFELVTSDLIRKRPAKHRLPTTPNKAMTLTRSNPAIAKPANTSNTKEMENRDSRFTATIPKAAPVPKTVALSPISTAVAPQIASVQAAAAPKTPPQTIPFTPIQARPSGWASINGSQRQQQPIAPVRQHPTEIIDRNEEDEEDGEEEAGDKDGYANTEELSDDEYIVESIKDVKSKNGKLLFLVCWAGDWPPDQKHTWEPYENINSVMTTEFLAANPAKAEATRANALIKRFYKRERQRSRALEKKRIGLDTVMSAFAGDEEWLEDNAPLVSAREGDEAVGEGDAEVLLVTENGRERNGMPFEFRWD